MLAVNDEWPGNHLDDPLRDDLGLGLRGYDYRELIASEPSNKGTGRNDFEQASCYCAQQTVAEKMAEPVIERFKAIEIYEEYRWQIAGLLQGAIEILEEQPTVRQIG